MLHRILLGCMLIALAGGAWITDGISAAEAPLVIEDDYDDNSALWNFLGSAAIVSDGTGNKVLQLTPATTSQTGTVWLNQPISPPFEVEFKYRMLNNRDGYLHYGADGIVFMFNKQQNIAPVNGGGMGFEVDPSLPDNGNGYGVEFDTFHNEEWDSSGSHIALFHKTPSSDLENHRLANADVSGINSSTWKQVRIEVTASSVDVYWGNSLSTMTKRLSWTGPALDTTYSGIGLSSSTGWGYSTHQIDDFKLTHYAEETPDEEPPVITLIGSPVMNVLEGTPYADPGYEVTDNRDIEVEVTVHGTVDSDVPGTYTIVYEAVDAAGNQASVTRFVHVVPPPSSGGGPAGEPLKIELIGEEELYVEAGSNYTDPGYTVTDTVYSSEVTVLITGTVDTHTPGTYTIVYEAANPAGDQASVTRIVHVIPPVILDKEPPVIALNGPAFLIVERGTAYIDPGASVTDNADIGLQHSVTGIVDTSVSGTYLLTYHASDAAANAAATRTRTVVVVDRGATVSLMNTSGSDLHLGNVAAFLAAGGGDLSGDGTIQTDEIRYLLSLLASVSR